MEVLLFDVQFWIVIAAAVIVGVIMYKMIMLIVRWCREYSMLQTEFKSAVVWARAIFESIRRFRAHEYYIPNKYDGIYVYWDYKNKCLQYRMLLFEYMDSVYEFILSETGASACLDIEPDSSGDHYDLVSRQSYAFLDLPSKRKEKWCLKTSRAIKREARKVFPDAKIKNKGGTVTIDFKYKKK